MSANPEPWELVVARIKLEKKSQEELFSESCRVRNSLSDILTAGEESRIFWTAICRHIPISDIKNINIGKNRIVQYFHFLVSVTTYVNSITTRKTQAQHSGELYKISTAARTLKALLVVPNEDLLNKQIKDEPPNSPMIQFWTDFCVEPTYAYNQLGNL